MSPRSFAELLEKQADSQPDLPVLRFLDDGEVGGSVSVATFAHLRRRARSIAAALRESARPGDRVLLVFPPGLDFVEALLGAFHAGVIAVPAYAPDPARLERSLARLENIVADCAPTLALTSTPFLALARSLTEGRTSLTWLATDAVPEADFAPHRADASDVALLQYTSGSTGDPRGVRLTHGNLLANSARIRDFFGQSTESRGVMWMPPYHDMGLVGGILQPLFTGYEMQLLSPMHVLQRPARWLEAVSAFRATISGGPNFGYELALRAFASGGRETLDLSHWNLAFNGAEPIRPETLERFAAFFAPCGFRKEALHPCYGLAESTLIVTGSAPLAGVRAFALDAHELREGRVVETAAPDQARRVVGCGRPAADTELAIVDPETGTRAGANEVGEIWLRSPSIADGYYGKREASELAFGARIAGDERPWLRTGDLGAMLQGELVITGRRKDLLVIHGQNYYPQDIEHTTEAAHPGVRAGCVAAFAVDGADGERAVVVAEVRRGAEEELAAIVPAVRAAVGRTHELSVELVLVPAGTLQKTSSGKLQRSATRARFVAGELPVLAVDRGPLHDADSPAYQPLGAHFDKLDRRRTSYRYDIETDIPWELVDDPRDCFGPTYLRRLGIDVDLLRTEPRAWELVQWGLSSALCRSFTALEEAVVAFLHGESARLGERRSMALLDEEEAKHIATFDRYAALVGPRHPEHAADVEAYLENFRAVLRHVTNPARAGRAAEHHYTMWLLFCWFEEFTVLLHDLFAVEGSAAHPTWLAIHRAHKQEEQQHVLTDHAYLEAIDATEEERYAWSRAAFDLAGRVAIGMNERDFALGLVRQKFPELAARLVPGGLGVPLFVTLMREGLFPRTCAAGPYFAAMAREPGERTTGRIGEGALVEWLRAWVRNKVGQPVGVDTPFNACGLDSLGAMELSGELERRLGRRISPTIVYEHPTISLLAGALGDSTEAATAASETDGPHARAERLLALDAHHPGRVPDAITAVFESPAAATGELERAFLAVVARHPALSHGWRAENRRFRRVALPAPEIRTVHAEPHEFQDILTRIAAEQDATAFDLATHAPWRATRVLAPDAAALVLTVHHVATDGWSMALIHRELTAILRGMALPPVPLVDHAAEEARFLRTPDAASRLAWWRTRLAGHPRFHEPSRAFTLRGASVSHALADSQFEGVRRCSRRLGASPFEVMLAAWHRVQARHEGTGDVLVQTHLLNRRSDAERKVVGYRVNPIVLRTDLSGTSSFDDALERVRRAWMDALDHELSIDHLVRELWPERWLDRWMPARWAFNHIPAAETASGPDAVLPQREDVLPPPQFLFFDGMMVVRPRADGLEMTLWYDRDTVPEREAQTLVEAFSAELVSLAPRRHAAEPGARATP